MKKIIYIIIGIIILAASCTEPYNPTLEGSFERLVVQGSITNELKHHQVSLTKSADYFSNQPAPRVTGAEVTISDGENVFILTEVSDGLYETDIIAGETGKTYTLTIIVEGRTYEASCRLNSCPEADSINFGFYDFSDYDIIDSSAYVLLSAQEPETPGNYYMWNIYINDVLYTDTINEVYFADDQFVNGYYLMDIEAGWIRKAYIGDTVTLETLSITEEYYNYISQLLTVTDWNMGPFGGPAANPNGNIYEVVSNDNNNDDPLGFFLAYSSNTIRRTIPPKEYWKELRWY
jgi:hypothetical protein